MRVLTKEEYQMITALFKSSQETLLEVLPKFLKQNGYKKIAVTKDYIYAQGKIPIALVAHLDTVGKILPYEIFYDKEKGVMISPQLLGADDRAGVFSIIKIIQDGYKPHIIFTTDEEIGCVGASQLALLPCPFKDLRYIIQLDRRNANDCVFYDCDNPTFEQYVESFGFVTQWGSFTDICELCPAWGIAGVNLSIGYRDEHTKEEVLFVGQMFDTIQKVKNMLSQSDIPSFKFIPAAYTYKNSFNMASPYYDDYEDFEFYEKNHNFSVRCGMCNKPVDYFDTLEVKMIKGGTKSVCCDCLSDPNRVEWCRKCSQPFEISQKTPNAIYCRDCQKEVIKNVHKSGDGRKD